MASSARILAVATVMIGGLALAGCSAAAPTDPDPGVTRTPPAPSASEETARPSPPAGSGSGSADAGPRPEWAVNPLDIGTFVGEAAAGDWRVQAYNVGTARTATDGTWAMPESNEPVMPAGTELTMYNLVITNTGGRTELLDGTEVAMSEHQGVPDYAAVLGTNEDEPFAELGLSRNAYDTATYDALPKYGDERGFAVGPGESFAAATSTWTDPGAVRLMVTVNVMDEQGKRLVERGAAINLDIVQ